MEQFYDRFNNKSIVGELYTVNAGLGKFPFSRGKNLQREKRRKNLGGKEMTLFLGMINWKYNYSNP